MTANLSRTTVIMFIVALMVTAPLSSVQAGKAINYGAISRDGTTCGGTSHKPCLGKPVN
ncbi:hypothetical protein CRG98_048636, partial [Punica granatum]